MIKEIVEYGILVFGFFAIGFQATDLLVNPTNRRNYRIYGLIVSVIVYGLFVAQFFMNSHEQRQWQEKIRILSNRAGQRELSEPEQKEIVTFFRDNQDFNFTVSCVELDKESCDFAKNIKDLVAEKLKIKMVFKEEKYLSAIRDILVVYNNEVTKRKAFEICEILSNFDCIHKESGVQNPTSRQLELIFGSN